ncbi:MAG TPA: hypothetical protein VNG35_16475 [Gemmatimonadales bacterium]|nr:hypothetical protein [Gemmatimonadales bacterium]
MESDEVIPPGFAFNSASELANFGLRELLRRAHAEGYLEGLRMVVSMGEDIGRDEAWQLLDRVKALVSSGGTP